ncbi:helix-turn-helix domain containing protein [Sporosarcina obsidiansis]|uniref:helix-turn-helix domain containing protein n=1 Tax=Sporosarcina obsidiansis TaxID=2660748 RepID=UPI00129B31E0|nr:helix-turn-helix domain containing protein [Sporosarcina obsidiansis]
MVNSLKQEEAHILLENADVQWYWDGHQVIRFRELWREGASIEDIAEVFGRNLLSTALLVLDQADQGYIKQRDKGLFGK